MAAKKKNKPNKTPKIIDKKELSAFNIRFCSEYIKDLNGCQAFMRAGGSDNERSAASMASTLLTKLNIKAQIEHLASERSKRTEINADTILKELLLMASVDLTALYDATGTLLPPHKWPPGLGKCISSVEHGEHGELRKVKFWPKDKSLELLGKHLKLFTDRVEHSGVISLDQMIGGTFVVKPEIK